MKTVIYYSDIKEKNIADLMIRIEKIIEYTPQEIINLSFQNTVKQLHKAKELLNWLKIHKDKMVIIGFYRVGRASFLIEMGLAKDHENMFFMCERVLHVLKNKKNCIRSS